jgi:hypothetical protein
MRWRFTSFITILSKVTPAMAAGVTDRFREVAGMVGLLEAWEAAI